MLYLLWIESQGWFEGKRSITNKNIEHFHQLSSSFSKLAKQLRVCWESILQEFQFYSYK